MITNNLSFSSIQQFNNFVKPKSKGQTFAFKAELKADSFNGKTLSNEKASLTELTLEFLGKSKKRRPKQNWSQNNHPNNNAQKHSQRKGNSVQELLAELVAGPYGKSAEYRNLFETNLKATPNPNLREELANDRTIYNVDRAEQRISSLSRYLKEDMIGFITPSGHHWFEEVLVNFIHGAKARTVPENQYKNVAKELWSLIAKADPYWTSPEFTEYLQSMNPSSARDATIRAIEEINLEKRGLLGKVTFGYRSLMKDMQKILDDGCAYTGVPMKRRGGNQYNNATAEHIFPHSKGGPDSDFNYLIAAAKPNQERGNMPLVDFLRGRNQYD